jgi:hypothetical protein
MGTLRTIRCADCGHGRETARANTKYCRLCRLFRDLSHLKGRTSTCIACGARFAPLTANDGLCSKCDFLAENNARGRCNICETDNALLIKAGVAVCNGCAKDPKRRKVVVMAVAQKRRRQIEAPDPELVQPVLDIELPAEEVPVV